MRNCIPPTKRNLKMQQHLRFSLPLDARRLQVFNNECFQGATQCRSINQCYLPFISFPPHSSACHSFLYWLLNVENQALQEAEGTHA